MTLQLQSVLEIGLTSGGGVQRRRPGRGEAAGAAGADPSTDAELRTEAGSGWMVTVSVAALQVRATVMMPSAGKRWNIRH